MTAQVNADGDAGAFWVRFAVDAAEDPPPETAAAADAIDTRLAPWAFRLPRYKTDRLLATVEDITEARPADPSSPSDP